MKKFLMSVCAGVLMAASSFAGEGWLTDFEEAKKQSEKTGKPILADFSGSDWCGWCIRFDEEVFSQKKFKEYAEENLVLLLIDFPDTYGDAFAKQSDEVKKQNNELAVKYEVSGFPTVLFLDKNGKVLARSGYQAGGAENYISHIKSILKK